jgi:hypothetical protein
MRYNFNLLVKRTWKDMIFKPRYFWGMWGVKQTLKYIWHDTFIEPIFPF